ncbi:MAG: helix-turn-helix transcriptional regulator [Patescibacteria group bacterium]
MKMKTFQQFRKESLKRPGVRRAMEDTDIEFQLVEAMIRARLKSGVTQRQLADKIGVAQSALARFESGRVSPTLSFVKKVTQGLGLKLVVK